MAARKDKRRQEVNRFLEIYRGFGAPNGDPTAQALWIMLARHGTKEGARASTQALWSHFVDVNEFRSSSLSEIAEIIRGHVKNDPMRVADQMRGFLRRFFRDFHSIDFLAAAEKTPEGLKKYFRDLDDYAQEIGLGVFLRLCAAEIEAEAAEAAAVEAPPEAKPKKRPEKDLSQSLERMRLACGVAAYGNAPSKAKIQSAPKVLHSLWPYSALPPLPPPPPPPPKPAPLPEVEAPAPVPAKGSAKTASRVKQDAAPRGGGKSRPRTTRATRQRSSSKKSSRR